MRDAPTTHGKTGDARNDGDRDWGGAPDDDGAHDRALIAACVGFWTIAVVLWILLF